MDLVRGVDRVVEPTKRLRLAPEGAPGSSPAGTTPASLLYTFAVCTHRHDRRVEFEAPRDQSVAAAVDVGGITACSHATRDLRTTSAFTRTGAGDPHADSAFS